MTTEAALGKEIDHDEYERVCFEVDDSRSEVLIAIEKVVKRLEEEQRLRIISREWVCNKPHTPYAMSNNEDDPCR